MISHTEQVRLPGNGYEQETGSKKRLVGVVIAVVLHVLLIYGFTSGLATDLVQKVQKTVNVSVIPEAPPPPPPPPPEEIQDTAPAKPQQRAAPKAYVPKAEVQTKQQSNDTITALTTEATEATPAVDTPAPIVADAAPVKKAEPVKTKARLLAGCRVPKYPARSEEKGEEGVVIYSFLVGVDGRVTSAQLVKSSGFDRLDNAAKEAFMQCKFSPGTVDGAAVASWVKQPFTWKIK